MLRAILGFFRTPPVLTKAILLPSIILPLMMHLRLLNPYRLFASPAALYSQWQWWRIATPFFIEGVSLSWLFSLMNKYQSLQDLELDSFSKNHEDLTFMMFLFAVYCHVSLHLARVGSYIAFHFIRR